MSDAVIVAAARSPIGRARRGSLTALRPDDLAATIIEAALDQVPQLERSEIDDLYLGCGEPYDEHGANMARRVAVLMGLDSLPGATTTRFCASSLQTTRMAFHAIRAGEGDTFISAGVECISRYFDEAVAGRGSDASLNPRFDDARTRSQTRAESNESWINPRESGLLPDVYIAMGQTAENVAKRYDISREEQDQFALRSQNLTERAAANGFHEREITAVRLPDGTVADVDDSPRPGSTYEGLAALRPAFRASGTVTAGNCCSLSDGAAAIVIMSDTRAHELGITPWARIVATGVSALSPEIMGLGPVQSSRLALKRAGMTLNDIDLVEINEAFAAQVIPSYRELNIDIDRLNVHGGAIALGHPFGMTGARLTLTLINGLRTHDKQIGLETLCVGGGQGMAMIVERLS